MSKKISTLLLLFIFSFLPAFAFDDSIDVKNENGIYTFKIPLKKYKNRIRPYVVQDLTTAAGVFKTGEFELVVNGGFFDPVNNLPVSNVIIDKISVQSLFDNTNLVESLHQQNRLEKVLNRSEFRVLRNMNGDISFDIARHFDEPSKGSEIIHSLQAGPMLIPDFNLEKESFIKFENNKPQNLAADVLKRRERTIIGIKYNPVLGDNLYIIIFTKDNKKALNEVRDYCKNLGLDKAMAFDGGASVSLNYKNTEIFSSDDYQRKLKSFLVIEN